MEYDFCRGTCVGGECVGCVDPECHKHRPRPFRDWTVRRAEAGVQTCTGIVGWNLYLEEGGSVWLTSVHCAETPKPGEVARFYGKGFGFVIEGIDIGGRFYR